MLTLLKIGGSLITHKESDEPSLDTEQLTRIAAEIKNGMHQDLILVHGAGSYGHRDR